MPIPAALLDRLRSIFPDALATDEAERFVYGYDNSRREALPDAVVFPTTHEQVAALVEACRAHRTPIVARGRGTNTTGASVPVAGGVVASFERMSRIVAIAPPSSSPACSTQTSSARCALMACSGRRIRRRRRTAQSAAISPATPADLAR